MANSTCTVLHCTTLHYTCTALLRQRCYGYINTVRRHSRADDFAALLLPQHPGCSHLSHHNDCTCLQVEGLRNEYNRVTSESGSKASSAAGQSSSGEVSQLKQETQDLHVGIKSSSMMHHMGTLLITCLQCHEHHQCS